MRPRLTQHGIPGRDSDVYPRQTNDGDMRFPTLTKPETAINLWCRIVPSRMPPLVRELGLPARKAACSCFLAYVQSTKMPLSKSFVRIQLIYLTFSITRPSYQHYYASSTESLLTSPTQAARKACFSTTQTT